MPRKQTRRSISISGATYNLLKAYCVKHDRSMSSIVEETLKASFPDDLAPDTKIVVDARETRDMPPTADELFDEAFNAPSATRPPPSKPEKPRPKGGVFTF